MRDRTIRPSRVVTAMGPGMNTTAFHFTGSRCWLPMTVEGNWGDERRMRDLSFDKFSPFSIIGVSRHFCR